MKKATSSATERDPIGKNPRRTTVSAEVLRGVSVTQYMRATNHVLAPPARRHFTTSSEGFPECALTVTTSTAKTQDFTVFNYRKGWSGTPEFINVVHDSEKENDLILAFQSIAQQY